MISQIYQDNTLFGHSLLRIPHEIWAFSRAEIAESRLFLCFIELIVRRALAFFVAGISVMTLTPLGFVAKILHHTVHKISSPFVARTSFACLALNVPVVLTFQSPEKLQNALFPHTIEEVKNRIASSQIPLDFQCNDAILERRTIPIRNSGTGNLLQNEVFKTKLLTVYYPETPRVPHHLTIALNRQNIKGITDVTEEENQALFATIRKIAEIYKTVSIQGFVVAQFDTPQQGSLNRYVVEIIPHLPGFNDIKNAADKADCNRYVLFRQANLTSTVCKAAQESIEKNAHFWQSAFREGQVALKAEDVTITFPYFRYESHEKEAQHILRQHFLELLQDKGAQVSQELSFEPIPMPTEIPDSTKAIEVSKCPFCDPAILQKQLVYEHNDVKILYNIRKGAKPGCTFLVLPKRHSEKIYTLSSEEIHNISIVRKVSTQS